MTVPPPTSLLDDDSGCGSPEEICCKNRKLLGVSHWWRRNQLRSPFSLSGVSKRAHSILPSISLLGTTIGGRYCHCYMHGRGGGDCRSPLYSTHSHTIIPLPSFLPSFPPSLLRSPNLFRQKEADYFPRYFSLRPNIRVIIMDLLLSHLFCPISLSTRCCNKESHLQQRRSLHVLPTPYSPSLPAPSHSILPPADQPTVTVSRD